MPDLFKEECRCTYTYGMSPRNHDTCFGIFISLLSMGIQHMYLHREIGAWADHGGEEGPAPGNGAVLLHRAQPAQPI